MILKNMQREVKMFNFLFGVILGAIIMMAHFEPNKLADGFRAIANEVEEKSNAIDPVLSAGP